MPPARAGGAPRERMTLAGAPGVHAEMSGVLAAAVTAVGPESGR